MTQAIPTPNRLPTTYKAFYRLIVRGKDEATNQLHVKGWLRDCWLPVDPVYGRRTEHGLPPLTEGEEFDAVNALFSKWKGESIDLRKWTFWASDYVRWWEIEKAEGKRRGGKARAKQAAAQQDTAVAKKGEGGLTRRKAQKPPLLPAKLRTASATPRAAVRARPR
jgi:hypothetical protein